MRSMTSLRDKILTQIAPIEGVCGVLVRDLATGEEIAVNAETPFRAASLIKVPILWAFFRECQAGRADPEEWVAIPPASVVPGFGVIRTLRPGLRLRLRDLAALMIVVSDNTATNLLIERLGLATINTYIRSLGLSQTHLQRRMFDYAAPGDNRTSPRDLATQLEAILTADDLAADPRAEMLAILKGQQCRNKLRSGIPDSAELAHKTGDLPGIEHDGGILFLDDRAVIVVVMTEKLASNRAGVELCRDVASLVYEHFIHL